MSYQYWEDFYERLKSLIGIQALNDLKAEFKDDYKELSSRYRLLQVEAVQNHISSTHTWVEGKMRSSNKFASGWFINPLECKVCKMGATVYHELGWAGTEYVKLKDGEIPSRDMHNSLIHRTCAEVQQARLDSRKNKKTKCLQCGTFGCLSKGS